MQFFQEKENQVSHSFDCQSHISTVMKKNSTQEQT